jgi:hypothetical protein
MMKVRILWPIAEMSESLGRYIEYKIGEEVELEDERAIALSKSGLVELLEEEKALDSPPKDKMIHRAKKK